MTTNTFNPEPTSAISLFRDRTKKDFDAIIDNWRERPRCTRTNLDGSQCRRSASWRFKFHTCSKGLLCTQHLNAWRLAAAAAFSAAAVAGDRGEHCLGCGQVFDSLEEVCTVSPL